MPQLHRSRRTGRRLLATGAIAAVAVLGTPAVASADPVTDILGGITGGNSPITGGDTGSDTGTDTGTGTGTDTGTDTGTGTGTGGTSPVGGGTPELPGPEDLEAGAACVQGLVEGIQVQVGQIVGGLTGILVGLTGGGSTEVVEGQAVTIPMTPEEFLDLLSPEQLEQLLAGGQESLTVGIPLVVEGVAGIVPVVFDFVDCLAALIPTPEAAPSTEPAPAYTPPATQPAAPVTTQPAAPAQAVAYPGYAPTGGAPSDDSSPAGLVGLGALVAATGGGALWLRARRGVAG